MSAQTWKRFPFHGIFSFPLPPHLRLHTHTYIALCGTEPTEGLWKREKQEFISPQHKKLILDIPFRVIVEYSACLLGFLMTIMFSSDLKISFLYPLLFYLLQNHQFMVSVFFSSTLHPQIASSLREILVPAVKITICFNELHVMGKKKSVFFSVILGFTNC